MSEQENIPPEESGYDAADEQAPSSDQDGNPVSDPRLDWIDQSRLPTPIEELPTLHWPEGGSEEVDSETEPLESMLPDPESRGTPADANDVMAWLEQMAAGGGAPIDEMPTLVSSMREADPPVDEMPSGDSAPSKPPAAGQAGKDPDSDPMAWLEQLAVGQVSPLEELPSVADRLLASEVVSQLDDVSEATLEKVFSTVHGPEEVEQALSYLEQLAAAQGVRWHEVPLDLSQPVESLDEALAVIDRIALLGAATARVEVPPAPVVNDQPEPISTKQPEAAEDVDPGEPETTAPQSPKTSALDHETAIAPDTLLETSAVDLEAVEEAWDDLSARMPEDPQEALSWLSNFAEEELASGVIISDDAAASPTEGAASVQKAELAEPNSSDEADDDASQVDFALDEMPDDPDEAMAWMRQLATRQRDATSPGRSTLAAREVPEEEAAADSDVGSQEAPDEEKHALHTARNALNKGDLSTALTLYKALLAQGSAPSVLAVDLEAALEKTGPQPALLRLLGDSYTKAGDLTQAIHYYQQAFDLL